MSFPRRVQDCDLCFLAIPLNPQNLPSVVRSVIKKEYADIVDLCNYVGKLVDAKSREKYIVEIFVRSDKLVRFYKKARIIGYNEDAKIKRKLESLWSNLHNQLAADEIYFPDFYHKIAKKIARKSILSEYTSRFQY